MCFVERALELVRRRLSSSAFRVTFKHEKSGSPKRARKIITENFRRKSTFMKNADKLVTLAAKVTF